MRRIVTALLGTVTVLVLLFSYRTSTNSGSPVPAALGAPNQPAVTGNNPTPTPTPSRTTTSGGLGGGDDGGGSDDGGAAAPLPAPNQPATTSPPSTSSGNGTTTGTFTGDNVMTRWGPVQVRITVSKGRITQSQAVVYPWSNPRDQEINSYALPVLDQAAVQAQSAHIDMVSGATVTSGGYIQSLQSAIDKAHL
ncbi:FMN-binding protein [Oryzihumus sp.]